VHAASVVERAQPAGQLVARPDRNETRMMAVSVDTRSTFAPTAPRVLFDGVYNLRSDTGISYALHPTGDRFLMVRLIDDDAPSSMLIVMNWFAELRRLTSAAPR